MSRNTGFVPAKQYCVDKTAGGCIWTSYCRLGAAAFSAVIPQKISKTRHCVKETCRIQRLPTRQWDRSRHQSCVFFRFSFCRQYYYLASHMPHLGVFETYIFVCLPSQCIKLRKKLGLKVLLPLSSSFAVANEKEARKNAIESTRSLTQISPWHRKIHSAMYHTVFSNEYFKLNVHFSWIWLSRSQHILKNILCRSPHFHWWVWALSTNTFSK